MIEGNLIIIVMNKTHSASSYAVIPLPPMSFGRDMFYLLFPRPLSQLEL